MKKVIMTAVIIIIIALLILAFVMLFYVYYGGFKKVTAVKGERRDMYIAYKLGKGDYSEVSLLLMDVEKYLKNSLTSESLGSAVGIFFDEPGTVALENQRYAAGYIITEKDYEAFIENNADIKKAYFPAFEAVYATFPYKGRPSLFVAPDNVYPAIYSYLAQHSIQPNVSIEIYDKENKLMHFYMPTDIANEEIEKIFSAPAKGPRIPL